MDEQGCILVANDHAQRLLRRSGAELAGHDAHDLLHRGPHGEPLPRTRCAMRRAFHTGGTAQADEDWFARGDGTLLRISWLVTPYALGGPGGRRGTLVVFHPAPLPAPAPGEGVEPGALPELERLALLAETTTQLSTTLDADEALARMAALIVPRLADWAVVDLITERDEVWRTVVAHAENGAVARREDLQGPMPPIPEDSPMPLSRALRGVASTLTGPQVHRSAPDSGLAIEQRHLFESTGIHSAAMVSLRSAREVLGAVTLGRAENPVAFTPTDLSLLEDIARRAGLALDNARLYQRQRAVAETMQKHLLPQMPRVPDLGMAVRYQAAPDASQVGGDWYDAFRLADGSTALAIGDVVGHDLEAAAGMAQLRNMLRAYAWSAHEPPSRIVARLDEALQHITDVTMATMVFARIEPVAADAVDADADADADAHVDADGRDDGPGSGDDGNGPAHWRLSWTNAGHPPPLLISRDGVADYLTDGHGILLGAGADLPRTDATTTLPPGSTLVLYTDGLIEAPGHPLDEGLDRLRRHAAALAHRPLGPFTDQLLHRVRYPQNDDDVAVLALRTPGRRNR